MMKKFLCLLIILLFFFVPTLSEAKKSLGHKKAPVKEKKSKHKVNNPAPPVISEPKEFEEIEPDGKSEKMQNEPKTEESQEIVEEEEVKEHETVVEYTKEQEYKFMHEMLKVYKDQYENNYLDRENTLKLAKTYLDLGQRSTAKAYYMQLYNMYPDDPNIQFEMGKYYYACKQYNAALEFFKLSLASGNLRNLEVNEYTRKTYAKLGDEENELLYTNIINHLKGNL